MTELRLVVNNDHEDSGGRHRRSPEQDGPGFFTRVRLGVVAAARAIGDILETAEHERQQRQAILSDTSLVAVDSEAWQARQEARRIEAHIAEGERARRNTFPFA